MSYRVYFVLKGEYESCTHYGVSRIEVKQNHLHLYDKIESEVV